MHLYRALLHIYPASFRGEYGEEMAAVFARRRAQAGNVFSLAALWLGALLDTFGNALRVHADILGQDCRYLIRTLRKSPGFTVTAIAVAALGTGATTAAFTMVDHVLIRPLAFAHSDRLVKLWEDHSYRGMRYFDISPANYRDWKRLETCFESLGAYRSLSVDLVGPGEPARIDGASVTGEMFSILGVQPLLGRYLTPDDDRESAPATVVLSYPLWQNLFAGDPDALGRKILLDGAAYTVVGVMPPDFYFPSNDRLLWTAMRWAPDAFADRSDTYIYAIGRLKPGVSLDQARAEFRSITGQLARQFPQDLEHVGASLLYLRDDLSPQSRTALEALLWASLCVLLIACTNLANLLLARALGRRKELAVRAALGAGRERLIRQTLTESLLLAFAGGGLGILLARVSLPLLVRLVPDSLPIPQTPSMDPRVLAFALAVTFATGIVFGAVPALRVCRGPDSAGMREGSRGGVGGHRERLRGALVTAEICGCVVLLVSAGLFLRALWRIQAVDPGFRADHLLTLRTSLPMPKYEERAPRERFYAHVLNEARQLPGVTNAAYISFLPMVNRGGIWPVEVAGQPEDFGSRRYSSVRFVTPGFFATLGIPLRKGRDVRESDTAQSQLVAVVSESFVRLYWPGLDPIGRTFELGNGAEYEKQQRMVVGVVGNIRVRGLVQASEPQVYLPYRQHLDGIGIWYAPKDLVVRTTGNPIALAPALRRIVHEADPEQPVSDVQTMEQIVAAETAPRTVQVRVLGAFAAIALLLAAVGINGLLSFAISARTQEIGVRVALGASRGNVLAMVLREALLLAALGTAAGAAIALAAGRYLASLLAGIRPLDAPTFAVAIALAFGMALAGSLAPAIRALRIDPATAIRVE